MSAQGSAPDGARQVIQPKGAVMYEQEIQIASTGSHAQTGYAQAEKRTGSLELLDAELNELSNTIEDLRKRLDPVMNLYASEKVLSPASQIRGRVDRLRDETALLRRITSELDI